MSMLEQINSTSTETELFQLVEENLVDIETPLSWTEEADKLQQNGEIDKAKLLRAAVNRLHNF
ncbi:MAG: hypothetical protein QNJ56_02075 [Gammaproteobacteria bacterium]|nr:hypothetical protein [Gammaproteobacteria bacterium]